MLSKLSLPYEISYFFTFEASHAHFYLLLLELDKILLKGNSVRKI